MYECFLQEALEIADWQRHEQGDLRRATGLSSFTIAKMSLGENVNTSILTRICEALNCDIGDIIEVCSETKRVACTKAH